MPRYNVLLRWILLYHAQQISGRYQNIRVNIELHPEDEAVPHKKLPVRPGETDHIRPSWDVLTHMVSQINKIADRMYALYAICNALSPSRLDDNISNIVKERYGEQFSKMSRGYVTMPYYIVTDNLIPLPSPERKVSPPLRSSSFTRAPSSSLPTRHPTTSLNSYPLTSTNHPRSQPNAIFPSSSPKSELKPPFQPCAAS